MANAARRAPFRTMITDLRVGVSSGNLLLEVGSDPEWIER
jgi:hypothetical protein